MKTVLVLPVFVGHVAIAQVGNAGTAHMTQLGIGFGVGGAAQYHVDPVAGALERCTMVRRAQADQRAQRRQAELAAELAALAAGTLGRVHGSLLA